jgi:hypothetical protein
MSLHILYLVVYTSTHSTRENIGVHSSRTSILQYIRAHNSMCKYIDYICTSTFEFMRVRKYEYTDTVHTVLVLIFLSVRYQLQICEVKWKQWIMFGINFLRNKRNILGHRWRCWSFGSEDGGTRESVAKKLSPSEVGAERAIAQDI